MPDLETQLSILRWTTGLFVALFAAVVILYCFVAIDDEMQKDEEDQRRNGRR